MRRNRFIVEGTFRPLPRLTDKYADILLLLQRRRYVPTKTIAALIQSELTSCQKALESLRHDYGLIDARWAGTNAFYQEAVYFLTAKGYEKLKEYGLFTHKTAPDPEKFRHELGVNLIMASFELGAREEGIELVDHFRILDRPDCPSATRQRKEPFILPVQITYDGNKVDTEVESDGEFFALQTDEDTIIFPGFEFDRRNEPLEPEDYERASIKKKYIAYRKLVSTHAYEKRFGLEAENIFIAFVTINERHMKGMMASLERLTEGTGSELFIFKALPNYATYEKFPPPSGHMLTEPWLRVGHDPINLLDILKGPHGQTRESETSRSAISGNQREGAGA